MTFVIPKQAVRGVMANSGGALEIETSHGEVIRPFGFGGSLLDSLLFKTSDRAASEIQSGLAATKLPTVHGKGVKVARRVRRSWSVDGPLALAAGLAVAGLIMV
ncbi:hypothetical protein [Streptomyces sp. KLOTTS4A1]|uniref:hypothetical protein n=1 Tax=Streptomyces sp. KLOTTS4A1 TaxID=3390996 RepID=UPI0039F4D5A2